MKYKWSEAIELIHREAKKKRNSAKIQSKGQTGFDPSKFLAAKN